MFAKMEKNGLPAAGGLSGVTRAPNIVILYPSSTQPHFSPH
jgi:hypothetical protein